MIITENLLDSWVKSNSREAQGVIVELIYRLVCASSPRPKERRFPLGDSIGQHGEDGILDTDFSYLPFIPEGKSIWEIGTSGKAGVKATSDYSSLTKSVPEDVRLSTVFIFVTPLSGVGDWESTWKEDAQREWLEKRNKLKEWKDIRIIDGTRLIDWLKDFPAVEIWLAGKMDKLIDKIETSAQRWDSLRLIGDPPPLSPDLFCIGREAACSKLKEIFTNIRTSLQIDSRYPDQISDVVAAYVSTLPPEEKLEIEGKCLIISSRDSWNVAVSLNVPHFLVADFDVTDNDGVKLIEKARRNKHSYITRGNLGGIPHPNRVEIRNPKTFQLQESLEKAGYTEERARILAHKSDGNLNTLLRCLQNLSLAPEWALNSEAANLAIAQLLGSWTDDPVDAASIEEFLGKPYGEWIGTIHNIVTQPNAPLIHYDGKWKFIGKYEGWSLLAPKIINKQLELFKVFAVRVLKEKDPKYLLPKDKRFYSATKEEKLRHSELLRKGVSESLAIIGSRPGAVTSIPTPFVEAIASSAVKEILHDGDWILWASLKNVLPMLAEASPEEFLNSVENNLLKKSSLFLNLFEEEGDGITGESLIAGLLWALESLAWDQKYTARVANILSALSVKDPGGRWSNRPVNSLIGIFLPWYSQTCAPFEKKKNILKSLVRNYPEISWNLLIALLPDSYSAVSSSNKPMWREIIPEDWSPDIYEIEFKEQVEFYAEELVLLVEKQPHKLINLIDKLDSLPSSALEKILTIIKEKISIFEESHRVAFWNELNAFITKHRKFHDSDWALKPEEINRIAIIANEIAPVKAFYKFQALFTDKEFALYDRKSNFENERKKVESKRQEALKEILLQEGPCAIVKLINEVESPGRVGGSLAIIATDEVENILLPSMLNSNLEKENRFIGSYVWSAFYLKGLNWINDIKKDAWSDLEKGQFLAYLPFNINIWQKANSWKGEVESIYWAKVNANPYAAEDDLNIAIENLLKHKRYDTVIDCIGCQIHQKVQFSSQFAIEALFGINEKYKELTKVDSYTLVELINELQKRDNVKIDELLLIEWLFLDFLREGSDGRPLTIEQYLADNPGFFHQLVRSVYKSELPENTGPEFIKLNATKSYKVLNKWKRIPGIKKDGSFDEEHFFQWISEVKDLCEETGHLEVAFTLIGQTLVNSPADPDGLWIHNKIAQFLDHPDSAKVRRGFSLGFYNSRGVHWVDPEGKQELELANTYKIMAESAEDAGYIRLAITMRDLGSSYEKEAVMRKNNEFDD